MRRVIVVIVLILFFGGCSSTSSELDHAIALRQQLLNSRGAVFDAVITADYSEGVYVFSVCCETDASGNLSFTVTDPQSISGICGTVSAAGGNLTYEDMLLGFPMLADNLIAPACAPWLMLNILRTGYIQGCGRDGEGVRISFDDSFQNEPIQMELWTDQNNIPLRAEFIWSGRRILSVDIRSYSVL